jgi:murein L,D-transpeptidase YcbB/YkuD
LKKRLILSDDLTAYTADGGPLFDDTLYEAIVRFQRRHGLKPDGIVGPDTLSALNISAQRRLRQIEVNLERMRWLGRNLGHRYILVNIADFKLDLVDRDQRVMSMGVVAGKPYWNTPVFTEKMKYIIFNPWWSVPESITKEELLPKIQMNPGYLTQQKMKMFNGWGKNAEEINTDTIKWDTISIETFPYIFRQEPGPLNPLGKIKFMLPNKFNIYLHDTPAKGLFSENSRAFSHGCIRVEGPLNLAEYLLQDDPDWDREKIGNAIEGGEETRIDLASPITVHVVYLTAWVDDDDILHFRNDIYGRDDRLDKALRKKPEALSASLMQ